LTTKQEVRGIKNLFKKFYTCPSCGNAISGEKRQYLACPNCGAALCRKKDIKDFDNTYCGNCGYNLSSVKKRVMALLKEKERN